MDTSGNHWVCSSGQSDFTCSVDDSGCGIVCVDKQHCPYAEESQQIRITVHVSTEHFLVESYSTRFFLSEIGETFVHTTQCSLSSVLFLFLPVFVLISRSSFAFPRDSET